MYVGLKFGKVSAWIWWQAASKNENENTYELLTFNGKKFKRYYTMKHFARYIRPNAFSVSATCASDVDILPLAFQHDKKKTLTVVLINQSNASKTVKLAFSNGSGTVPSSYKIYQTNESDNCADKGSLAANATLTIPANTLVTLLGEGSEPTVITSNESSVENTQTLTHFTNEIGNIIVQLPNSNFEEIQLVDLTGKVVYTKNVSNMQNDVELQTSSLNKGAYIMIAKGATIAKAKVTNF
jgi:hypothetical protein